MKYYPFLFIFFALTIACRTNQESQKYTVGCTSWAFGQYSFLNARGDTIRKLSPNKYIFSFTNKFQKFAVFGIKGKQAWYGVDIREHILFKVLNESAGEISPDSLVEGMIRIVGENGKIGFANTKGKIVIQPQFESVTYFHNGYAIIREDCHEVAWPNDEETEERVFEIDPHYGIECHKCGYIDTRGKILKMGNYTFEEIQSEIGW